MFYEGCTYCTDKSCSGVEESIVYGRIVMLVRESLEYQRVLIMPLKLLYESVYVCGPLVSPHLALETCIWDFQLSLSYLRTLFCILAFLRGS